MTHLQWVNYSEIYCVIYFPQEYHLRTAGEHQRCLDFLHHNGTGLGLSHVYLQGELSVVVWSDWILFRITLKFVPKVRINSILALSQIMAWRRPGDKPLSEPMMICLLTHICVTRPQWVSKLVHGRCGSLWIGVLSASCRIGIRWMPQTWLIICQH